MLIWKLRLERTVAVGNMVGMEFEQEYTDEETLNIENEFSRLKGRYNGEWLSEFLGC